MPITCRSRSRVRGRFAVEMFKAEETLGRVGVFAQAGIAVFVGVVDGGDGGRRFLGRGGGRKCRGGLADADEPRDGGEQGHCGLGVLVRRLIGE